MESTSSALRGEPVVLDNKLALADDLSFLSRMPELYDVTFIVGETREPIGAVRAILATRSRVFHKLLYSHSSTTPPRHYSNAQESHNLQKKVSRLIRRNSFDGKDLDLSKPRTITIDEFEPDVFRQLIDYCHTGCATLKPRTILGLLNAADYYGLEELRRACLSFLHGCINVDTVCLLLKSAERYIQYKATKSLVHKALEFIDANGESVLRLPAFTSLPDHVVRLVLSRDELNADEFTKFQSALLWAKAHIEKHRDKTLQSALSPFLDCIAFHLIPATTLMQYVRPMNVVPDQQIMTALAYQADPASVDPGSLSITQSRLSMMHLSSRESDTASSTNGADFDDDEDPDIEYDYPESLNNFDMGLGRNDDNTNHTNHTNGRCASASPSLNRSVSSIPGIRHGLGDAGNANVSPTQNGNNRRRVEQGKEQGKSDDSIDSLGKEFKIADANSTCCSMSTCSDLTDSGSSFAGSSFGKADEKDIDTVFKDSDGLPELP